MSPQLIAFLETMKPIGEWLLRLWWLWFFVLLVYIARALWLAYVQEFYKRSIKWVILELRVPREVRRSPRAMEQVFMTIHAVRNSASDYQEQYWDGEVPMWFSCEMVSFGGDIHFYMRIPKVRRNHVEAALYAQYPDIEIIEATEDYIHRLPPTATELRKAGYRLFGNELILEKRDAFPLRTYVDFEENIEERQLDPIAALLETFAKLDPREHIWVQILVRPTIDDSWKKAGDKIIEELKEKTGKRRVLSPLGEFIMIDRSPGDVEVMKAVDRNIGKPGFHSIVRYLYMAPQEIYSASFGRRSVLSSMNQYASEQLNRFKHNTRAWTLAKIWYRPYLFPKRRRLAREERMYENYRKRQLYADTFMEAVWRMKFFYWGFKARQWSRMVLNVEELATICHLPMFVVLTGPLMKRVESRKIGPPAGLAIYGKEGEKLPVK